MQAKYVEPQDQSHVKVWLVSMVQLVPAGRGHNYAIWQNKAF